MMKVMWLINNEIPFLESPEGKLFVNEGWITGMLTAIDQYAKEDIQLTILYPQKRKKENVTNHIKGVSTIGYYRNWPAIQYCPKLKDKFIQILKQVNPDVIHVMGSEYPHTYSICSACEELQMLDQLVISMQGLVSVCARHYDAFLPYKTIHSYTFRDLLKGNIAHDQKIFFKRGKYEIKSIVMAKNIIGRTEWDYACATQINPQIKYYFNNEVLRESFYESKWSYEKCLKHTIFISQGGYPIKGLHLFLEALPIIKLQYPDVQVKIAGHDILHCPWWKKSSYAKYIGRLVAKNDLQDNVVFTGLLTEEQIIEEYKKANIFVSPSIIENSSNSIGEAMLLGMPVISSDVGGVKNFIHHHQNGYIYPCDEPYMLAYYIMQYFQDGQKAIQMGEQAFFTAEKIFDRKENVSTLLSIYRAMVK